MKKMDSAIMITISDFYNSQLLKASDNVLSNFRELPEVRLKMQLIRLADCGQLLPN